jgi:hypothetical protein
MTHRRYVLLTLAIVASLAAVPAPTQADGNVNFVLGGRGLDEDFWEPNEGMGVLGVNVDFGPDEWPVRIALGLSGSSAENEAQTECHVCDEFDFGPFDLEDIDLADLGLDFGFFPVLQTVTSTVGELSAGVLYRPRGERKLIPFVGGGLSFISVEREMEQLIGFSRSDDDTTVGIYVNGGVYWRIGKRFNIGFDGRVVTGTSVELFGKKGDANYGQFGLILGWGW